MKRKLIKIADKILTLEEKIAHGDNVVESMEEMDKMTAKLTPDEMLEIDEYIQSKLTK